MDCLLERYCDFLPITARTPIITLGEGGTPLVRSRKLGKRVGAEVYFKLEGCNPTGSFKDRGMVMTVAKAIEEGSHALICASTGNTSASAAAYGAHCGLRVIIVIPQGNVASGKFAQVMAYGADVVPITGNFDQALELVRALVQKYAVTLVNSINPYRLEGQKTAAFEVIEELGDAPDYLFIPVGNAGNITAYWRGFCQHYETGKASHRPRMMGFQAQGAAPIVLGHAVTDPQTIATAIRIGNPAHWQGALNAKTESEGTIDWVSDEEILEAYRLLATEEGIFGEPASAAAVAGMLKQGPERLMGKKVVCIITGHGLKDPDTALKLRSLPQPCPPQVDVVEKVLGW